MCVDSKTDSICVFVLLSIATNTHTHLYNKPPHPSTSTERREGEDVTPDQILTDVQTSRVGLCGTFGDP